MPLSRSRSVLVTAVAVLVIGSGFAALAEAAPVPQAAPTAAGQRAQNGSKSNVRLSPRLNQMAQPSIQALPPQTQSATLAVAESGPGSLLTRPGGRILVDLSVTDKSRFTQSAITATGAQIVAVSTSDPVITVSVLPTQLTALQSLSALRWAQEVLTPEVGGPGAATPAPAPVTNATCPTGLVSEADVQLNAAAARVANSVNGAGIKVGLLSDSYNKLGGAAADELNAELPGPTNPCGFTTPVQIQSELAAGGADEGRAMAQAVHDLAPGSPLAFATAFNGEADFGNQIRNLQVGGAKVIADDITYYAEPMYQDGLVSKAVNDVTALGVTYFSSAANSNVILGGKNISSYEAGGGYRAAACPAGLIGFDYTSLDCHDFDPGVGVDAGDLVTVSNGGRVQLSLGWNQPQLGVTTDYDIWLVDTSTNTVVTKSNSANLVSQNTFEYFNYSNTSGLTKTYKVIVARYSGTSAPRFKIIFHRPAGWTAVQWNTTTGTDVIGPTIFGHNANSVAGSIAAVPYFNSNTVETYSSRGPTTYCFGAVGAVAAAPLPGGCQLKQLDIAATDGARNSFFGQVLGDGFWHFFGTSQSAPHAAAIATLQTQARPCRTPAQILAAQRSSGRAIAGFGQDALGSGLVDATTAITGLALCPVTFTVNTTTDAVDATLADNLCATAAAQCSLRAAVQQANALAAPVTIVLAPTTYTLSIAGRGEEAAATGDLDITGQVTVQGNGATVNGGLIDRVFEARPGSTVTMSNLTITGGSATTGSTATLGAGGGILNWGALTLNSVTMTGNAGVFGGAIGSGNTTLSVTNSTISTNQSLYGGGILVYNGSATVTNTNFTTNQSLSSGGGIWTTGTLNITGGTYSGNTAVRYAGAVGGFSTITISGATFNNNSAETGGAISGAGALTISSSSVTNNTATQYGGGVAGVNTTINNSTLATNQAANGGGFYNAGTAFAATGAANINRSTLSGNTATAAGAGIFNDGAATLTVDTSTIDANTATGNGGGIENRGAATVTNTTVTANAGALGGGIHTTTSTTVTNSIIGSNVTGSNCNGTTVSGGYNLTSDTSCPLATTGDVTNAAVMLGALANNGGPTLTRLPQIGSPAINTGQPGCTGTDQRGVARPAGGACNKGSVDN